MKISLPYKKKIPKRTNLGRKPRAKPSPLFLHGRHPPSGQKAQSPIKTWEQFTEAEKVNLVEMVTRREK